MTKKAKRRRPKANSPAAARRPAEPVAPIKEIADPLSPEFVRLRRIVLAVLFVVFLGAYWPNLVRIVGRWISEPDYSHGFLVIPFVIWCGFKRNESRPNSESSFAVMGLVLMAMGVALRVWGGFYYIDAVEDWSMLIWIAGAIWMVWGGPVFLWAAPLVGFLFFMIPLPFGGEEALAEPLQGLATKASTWTLQLLGQPALASGNQILLNEQVLDVERACSGLRIFMSMIALGVGYILINPGRVWWQQAALLVMTVPIALVSNSTRIVVTGLLHEWVSSDAAHSFSHSFAGWGMIVFAMALFWLLLVYLNALFPAGEDVRRTIVAKSSAKKAPAEA